MLTFLTQVICYDMFLPRMILNRGLVVLDKLNSPPLSLVEFLLREKILKTLMSVNNSNCTSYK